MAFTEEEKRLWLAARRAGLNPDDFDPEDLGHAVAEQEANNATGSDDDDEALVSSAVCTHCDNSLGEESTSEFALCHACDGD
ncbi:hypothetical protein [Sphingomonas sp. 22R3R2A-7]|uniref:hypothetical protein n=1 Tax=Sphingomonas sp. 22R3R2A-7 TaxID=3050230 RepID=UPI002FE244A4